MDRETSSSPSVSLLFSALSTSSSSPPSPCPASSYPDVLTLTTITVLLSAASSPSPPSPPPPSPRDHPHHQTHSHCPHHHHRHHHHRITSPSPPSSPPSVQFSSVQSLSHVRFFAAPWTAARQASLSITSSQSLLRFMSIESVMPSSHLIFCHPLLLVPSIFPSIRVFSNESTLCIRWPKYWSFSFSISPSNEYSGLIPFRMDWLDLLAVQGTLRSLLQHHSSKASVLWHSATVITIITVKLPRQSAKLLTWTMPGAS